VAELPDTQISPAARVAWTYLATIVAAVAGGALAAMAAAVVPGAVCAAASEADYDAGLTCMVFTAIALVAVFFVAAFAALFKPMKLDVWALCAFTAFTVGMLAWGRIDAWWWWTLMLFTPAATALASAPWFKGRAALAQRVALVMLAAGALAWLAISFVVAG
jgi:hypothetical protein